MKEFVYSEEELDPEYCPHNGEVIKLTDKEGVEFLVVFTESGDNCYHCAFADRDCTHYPLGCDDGHYKLVDTLLEDL